MMLIQYFLDRKFVADLWLFVHYQTFIRCFFFFIPEAVYNKTVELEDHVYVYFNPFDLLRRHRVVRVYPVQTKRVIALYERLYR